MQKPHSTQSSRQHDTSIFFVYIKKENIRHFTFIKVRNTKFEQEQIIKNIPTLATKITKNTQPISQ